MAYRGILKKYQQPAENPQSSETNSPNFAQTPAYLSPGYAMQQQNVYPNYVSPQNYYHSVDPRGRLDMQRSSLQSNVHQNVSVGDPDSAYDLLAVKPKSSFNSQLLAQALAEKSKLGLCGGPVDPPHSSAALAALQSYSDDGFGEPSSALSPTSPSKSFHSSFSPVGATPLQNSSSVDFMADFIKNGRPYSEECFSHTLDSHNHSDHKAQREQALGNTKEAKVASPPCLESIEDEDMWLYGDAEVPPKTTEHISKGNQGSGPKENPLCIDLTDSDSFVQDLLSLAPLPSDSLIKKPVEIKSTQMIYKKQIPVNLKPARHISKVNSEWEEFDDKVPETLEKEKNKDHGNSPKVKTSFPGNEETHSGLHPTQAKQDNNLNASFKASEISEFPSGRQAIDVSKKISEPIAPSVDIFYEDPEVTFEITSNQSKVITCEEINKHGTDTSVKQDQLPLKLVPSQLQKKPQEKSNKRLLSKPLAILEKKTLSRHHSIFASDNDEDVSTKQTAKGKLAGLLKTRSPSGKHSPTMVKGSSSSTKTRKSSSGIPSKDTRLRSDSETSAGTHRRHISKSPLAYSRSRRRSPSPGASPKKSYRHHGSEYSRSARNKDSWYKKYPHESSPRTVHETDEKEDYYYRRRHRSRSPKSTSHDRSPFDVCEGQRLHRRLSRSPSSGSERRSKRDSHRHSPDGLTFKTQRMGHDDHESSNSRHSLLEHGKHRMSDPLERPDSKAKRSRQEHKSSPKPTKDHTHSSKTYNLTSNAAVRTPTGEASLPETAADKEKESDNLNDLEDVSSESDNTKDSVIVVEKPKSEQSKADEVAEFFRRLEQHKAVSSSPIVGLNSAKQNIPVQESTIQPAKSSASINTTTCASPLSVQSSTITQPSYPQVYYGSHSAPQQYSSNTLPYGNINVHPPPYPPYNPYGMPPVPVTQFYPPPAYYIPPVSTVSQPEGLGYSAPPLSDTSTAAPQDIGTISPFKITKKGIPRTLKEVPVLNREKESEAVASPVLLDVPRKPVQSIPPAVELLEPGELVETVTPPEPDIVKFDLNDYRQEIGQKSKISIAIKDLKMKISRLDHMDKKYIKESGRSNAPVKRALHQQQKELEKYEAELIKVDARLTKMKELINAESAPEKSNLQEPVIKPDVKEDVEVKYFFFDSGEHWCQLCNQVFSTVTLKLDHLLTPAHRQHMDPHERYWPPPVKEDLLQHKTGTIKKRQPIKGSEFIIPVEGYFCTICKECFPDYQYTESHLKSLSHFENYKKFIKENEDYEKTFKENMMAGINVLQKEKKRKMLEEIRAAVAEKRQKNKDVKLVKEQTVDVAQSKSISVQLVGMKPSQPSEEKKPDLCIEKPKTKIPYIGKSPCYKKRVFKKPGEVANNEAAPEKSFDKSKEAQGSTEPKPDNSGPKQPKLEALMYGPKTLSEQIDENAGNKRGTDHLSNNVPKTTAVESELPTANAKKELPIANVPKQLPTVEAKKQVPTADAKKQIPTADIKKQMPTADVKKQVPDANVKKQVPIVDAKKQVPAAGAKKDLPTCSVTKSQPVEKSVLHSLEQGHSSSEKTSIPLNEIQLPKAGNPKANKVESCVTASSAVTVKKKGSLTEEEKDFLLLGINKDDMKPLVTPKPPPDPSVLKQSPSTSSSEAITESPPESSAQSSTASSQQSTSTKASTSVAEVSMEISPSHNHTIVVESFPPFPPPLQVPPPNLVLQHAMNINQQQTMYNSSFPPAVPPIYPSYQQMPPQYGHVNYGSPPLPVSHSMMHAQRPLLPVPGVRGMIPPGTQSFPVPSQHNLSYSFPRTSANAFPTAANPSFGVTSPNTTRPPRAKFNSQVGKNPNKAHTPPVQKAVSQSIETTCKTNETSTVLKSSVETETVPSSNQTIVNAKPDSSGSKSEPAAPSIASVTGGASTVIENKISAVATTVQKAVSQSIETTCKTNETSTVLKSSVETETVPSRNQTVVIAEPDSSACKSGLTSVTSEPAVSSIASVTAGASARIENKVSPVSASADPYSAVSESTVEGIAISAVPKTVSQSIETACKTGETHLQSTALKSPSLETETVTSTRQTIENAKSDSSGSKSGLTPVTSEPTVPSTALITAGASTVIENEISAVATSANASTVSKSTVEGIAINAVPKAVSQSIKAACKTDETSTVLKSSMKTETVPSSNQTIVNAKPDSSGRESGLAPVTSVPSIASVTAGNSAVIENKALDVATSADASSTVIESNVPLVTTTAEITLANDSKLVEEKHDGASGQAIQGKSEVFHEEKTLKQTSERKLVDEISVESIQNNVDINDVLMKEVEVNLPNLMAEPTQVESDIKGEESPSVKCHALQREDTLPLHTSVPKNDSTLVFPIETVNVNEEKRICQVESFCQEKENVSCQSEAGLSNEEEHPLPSKEKQTFGEAELAPKEPLLDAGSLFQNLTVRENQDLPCQQQVVDCGISCARIEDRAETIKENEQELSKAILVPQLGNENNDPFADEHCSKVTEMFSRSSEEEVKLIGPESLNSCFIESIAESAEHMATPAESISEKVSTENSNISQVEEETEVAEDDAQAGDEQIEDSKERATTTGAKKPRKKPTKQKKMTVASRKSKRLQKQQSGNAAIKPCR